MTGGTRGVALTCHRFYGISSSIPIARDVNHVFKFKVGDRVKKRWKWSKDYPKRFSGDSSLKEGIIHCILSDGEICVTSDGTYTGSHEIPGGTHTHWHFGATELDLLEEVKS